MSKQLLSFLTLLLIPTLFFAQKAPIKWGDIPPEELAMEVYDADPEAAAVVLANYGQVVYEAINQRLALTYKHHKRIKILTDQGFDQADITIPYYEDDDLEKVIKLRAQIFDKDGNKTVLTKKEFFDEDVNKFYNQKKFTFPGVTPGCIIEYQYEIRSENWVTLNDWFFQDDIPVRYNELIFARPDDFDYSMSFQGNRAFDEKSERSYTESASISGRSRSGNMNYAIATVSMTETRFVMKELPALKEEAFITTLKDYLCRLSFQLKTVRRNDGSITTVINTWEELAKEMMDSDGFGKFLKGRNAARAKEISLAGETSEEKLVAAHKFISSNIKWDGTTRRYVDQSFSDMLELKSGSNADINMALVLLLRENGIEAHPALTSTRAHGKMQPYLPFVDQFNYMIGYAKVGEKHYLLDATNPFLPHDLTPVKTLNHSAWVVIEGAPAWIDITPAKSKSVCSVQMELDAEGNASGTIDFSFSNHAAGQHRAWLKEEDKEADFFSKYLIENEAFEFSEHVFENLDDAEEKLNIRLKYNAPEFAESSGDLIYISPVFWEHYEENIFKLEERTYPVDIPYPVNETYVLTLTIPEGYGVEELPQNEIVHLPEDGGRFQFLCQQMPGRLQLVSKMDLDQIFFSPENYVYIKAFFDKIVEKHAGQIVLKKLP